MKGDVTRADVNRYRLLFEKTRRRHGLDIAIETIIAAERFPSGKAAPAAELSDELAEAGRAIVAGVTRLHGVTVKALALGGKEPSVVAARREACWRLRQIGLRLGDVGRLVGVSESTAHGAIRQFTAALKADPMLRRRMGVEAEGARRSKAAARRRAA